MKRMLFSLAALVALLSIAHADDAQKPVSVRSYGESGTTVLQRIADEHELALQIDEEAAVTARNPLWLVGEGLELEQALAAISAGLGVRINHDETTKRISLTSMDAPATGLKTKGYDVSVLAGQFIAYVNDYGQPQFEEDVEEYSASEYLSFVVDASLYSDDGRWTEGSVVGDRLLYTLDDVNHARVRELLALLMEEHGGESADLTKQRELLETLSSARYSGEHTATPISSVLAGIFVAAKVPFVLCADFVEVYGDWHVNYEQADEVSALAALETVLAMIESDDTAVLGVNNEVLTVSLDPQAGLRGYRVLNVSELLKKLDVAYQRQRTAPGKADGFARTLNDDGGVDVIVNALYTQMQAEGQSAEISSYGTRVVIRGGPTEVDAALAILKEMGWEKPQAE